MAGGSIATSASNCNAWFARYREPHPRYRNSRRAIQHAHVLGDRDLNQLDVVGSQRLEERVTEAEGQDVLDRFLAQVMVDAVQLLLGKQALEGHVELAGSR